MLAALLLSLAVTASPPASGGEAPARAGAPAAKAGSPTLDQSLTEDIVLDARVETLVPGRIFAGDGALHFVTLEKSQGLPSDDDSGSPCVLRENGQVLGPAHATTDRIQSIGLGAYRLQQPAFLVFSSSDNSDPATNGRTYTLDCTRSLVVKRSSVVTTAPVATFDLDSSGIATASRRLVVRNLDAVHAVRAVLRERGAPDLSSVQGILASVLAPGMSPEETSIAIWRLLKDAAYNWHPAQADGEIHDPVKFLNVYGYGYCDDYAETFAVLAEAAGIPARIHFLNGHVVPEAFYGGRWHMFDPDFGVYFEGPDGEVLGVEDLAADPTPILNHPVVAPLASLYTSTEDNIPMPPTGPSTHRMEPVLLPGDEMAFDLGPAPLVRDFYAVSDAKPPLAGTGTLTRRLTFPPGATEVVVPVEWPYALVGGTFTGAGEVALSTNGTDWTTTSDFAAWFAARSEASYAFQVRVRQPGPTATLAVAFQFSPQVLPAPRPGTTTFDLEVAPVSGTFDGAWQGIEIAQEWEDRPPAGTHAIATGAFPEDTGTATCTPDPVPNGGTSTCTATPAPGFALAGWSGDCAGATCTLANVTGPRSVTAQFATATYAVNAVASPVAGGSAACTPNPVTHGGSATCTATPATGYTFAGWSGDCTGAACELTNVTAPANVTANFDAIPVDIDVRANPSGSGTASCTPNPVPYGGTATCTATPAPNQAFTGWSGACSGLTCTLTNVTATPIVTANFAEATIPITANANPSTGGSVACTPNPAPVGGQSTCVATPAPGFAFSGWVEGPCIGTGPCFLNITAPVQIAARFETPSAATPRLANLSTRAVVRTGADILIGGFVIGGTQPKTVVVRARGPSLATAGVANVMDNPVLQVFAGQVPVVSNDNWQQAPNAAALQASGYAPAFAAEAALLTTLAPGAYTALVSGAGQTQGVALFEVFEVSGPAEPLVNLSTRGRVESGDDVLIGGFIIQGAAPQTVVIRARGPSLAEAGVSGALADPVLELYAGATRIATSDNWRDSAGSAYIEASGLAPSDPREAAIRIPLSPGAYTAVVRGAGGATGVAIVEVFAQ